MGGFCLAPDSQFCSGTSYRIPADYDIKDKKHASVIDIMIIDDDLDRRLLYELYHDGALSVPTLSKKLNSNNSVLYSRIKRLVRNKVIKKFTIQVDESKLGMGVRAEVGINRSPKRKSEIHKKLIEIPEVVSITEVTGRFDIIVSLHVPDLETLHHTVTAKISRIEGIQNTETFVELDRIDKDLEYLQPKS